MQDRILESIFLDTHLWEEVLEHGCEKGIPMAVLQYIQSPIGRSEMCEKIENGEYVIAPPHAGYKAKEDGGERTFFINEPSDRLLLNAIYKWLSRNEKQMVHPACQSYQEGIGVGKIVKRLSHDIVKYSYGEAGRIAGCKFDIHRYFESVDKTHIHNALDLVEKQHGASAVIDLLRAYYDNDSYYDSRKKEWVEQHQGIKQGCAVSAWLANVILYPLDERLSQLEGFYIRYSDDIIYIGPQWAEAATILRQQLKELGLELNEKKIEYVQSGNFNRFLGYYIRGGEITLSPKWVKRFQRGVERITICNKKRIQYVRKIRRLHPKDMEEQLTRIMDSAAKQLMAFLYLGDGRYSWATQVLNVLNRKEDIQQLNMYCLDALRAVYTGKTGIGGLGVSKSTGILRGKGSNVNTNREATEHILNDGNFCSMVAMQNIIHNKWLCRAVVWDAIYGKSNKMFHTGGNIRGPIDVTAMETCVLQMR